MDPRRAVERLSGDALEDPAAYSLQLVQWAASGVDVRAGPRTLMIAHDGAALSRAEAECLLEHLLSPAMGAGRGHGARGGPRPAATPPSPSGSTASS